MMPPNRRNTSLHRTITGVLLLLAALCAGVAAVASSGEASPPAASSRVMNPQQESGPPGASSMQEDGAFARVTGPCDFRFPQDHGPHLQYRTEWWYVTGNVEAGDGRPFGFQITLFRVGLTPPGEKPPGDPEDGGRDAEAAGRESAWRARDLYFVHAALTDVTGHTFRHFERASRAALDLAGEREEGGASTLFVGGNAIRIGPSGLALTADGPDFSFDLSGIPQKPPTPHGIAGYSRKGKSHESASCYYSLTRIATDGALAVGGGAPVPVRGLAWMDHEFSSAPLEPDLAGWDWFGLQLSDGSDLMIYRMRKKDGSLSGASSGTFVGRDGTVRPLLAEDIRVSPVASWKSPRSGAVYPSGWTVTVPGLGLNLSITPKIEDQEMQTPESTRVTYWEGSVGITGERAGNLVSGSGYVELTGYAGPVLMR